MAQLMLNQPYYILHCRYKPYPWLDADTKETLNNNISNPKKFWSEVNWESFSWKILVSITPNIWSTDTKNYKNFQISIQFFYTCIQLLQVFVQKELKLLSCKKIHSYWKLSFSATEILQVPGWNCYAK